VEVFQGAIDDEAVLGDFLHDGDLLFHCAAELLDEARMWAVNVGGTEKLLRLAAHSGIEHLCHLSSAGVVGKTENRWVDESVPCHPRNAYEKSKLASEVSVLQHKRKDCRVVVLRPTNVIDDDDPGALSLPMRAAWTDRLKVFLKGGECAHIVHAEDVAQAAMHLISASIEAPSCFFVSCDHEPLNTYAGLWSLYKAIAENRSTQGIHPVPHLPLIVPCILRRILRGAGNRGDVCYSANKLLATGFHFHLGIERAVRQIAVSRRQ
jgi:nucleoside-diphosphate-sugar epimerase